VVSIAPLKTGRGFKVRIRIKAHISTYLFYGPMMTLAFATIDKEANKVWNESPILRKVYSQLSDVVIAQGLRHLAQRNKNRPRRN
jgi:hypothetical protein